MCFFTSWLHASHAKSHWWRVHVSAYLFCCKSRCWGSRYILKWPKIYSPTNSSNNFAKGCGQNKFYLWNFSSIKSATITTHFSVVVWLCTKVDFIFLHFFQPMHACPLWVIWCQISTWCPHNNHFSSHSWKRNKHSFLQLNLTKDLVTTFDY